MYLVLSSGSPVRNERWIPNPLLQPMRTESAERNARSTEQRADRPEWRHGTVGRAVGSTAAIA
jgi:hypothetical protein